VTNGGVSVALTIALTPDQALARARAIWGAATEEIKITARGGAHVYLTGDRRCHELNARGHAYCHVACSQLEFDRAAINGNPQTCSACTHAPHANQPPTHPRRYLMCYACHTWLVTTDGQTRPLTEAEWLALPVKYHRLLTEVREHTPPPDPWTMLTQDEAAARAAEIAELRAQNAAAIAALRAKSR
jgi:hypothetical protein